MSTVIGTTSLNDQPIALISKTQPQNNKGREIWIDTVRGITMLLVLYAHLVGGSSELNSVFMTTRMPLFFFISGFFIYSVDYNLQLLRKRLKNRLLKQLYPTIILFSLFVILYQNNDFLRIFDEYKSGYWFTYVSVLYFITLAPLLLLFSRLKINSWSQILFFLILCAVSVMIQSFAAQSNIFTNKYSSLLSFDHYICYIRYVTLGCIFRILWNKYNHRLMNWIAFALSLAGFIIGLNTNTHFSIMCGVFGIYIVLFSVYKLNQCIKDNNKIIKWLSYIGSMTLEIYLIHYFILFSIIHKLYVFDIIKTSILNTPWEFPFYIVLSIIVALMCLVTVKILRKLRVYKYIFAKP